MSDKTFTVIQINNYIKNILSNDFVLSRVNVEGEISNCKYTTAGHIYFSLKDDESVISCVMFAGNRTNLDFKLEDGMKVIVSGKISSYEKAGVYQIYCNKITNVGSGDLHRRFVELKKELEEMGMFDKIYKKPIPKYSQKIGVATSQTGAAIKDIINITKRRNPYVSLYLSPCTVQGDSAPKTIVNSIKFLDSINLDVIIVGRGGGSIEDLWCFNDKEVAKAIFDAKTPIISAVGHEIDFTIADFVSDMRAPTPSAAAEIAIFDYDEFNSKLLEYNNRLTSKIKEKIFVTKQVILALSNSIDKYEPNNLILESKHRIANINNEINLSFNNILTSNIEKVKDFSDFINDKINSCVEKTKNSFNLYYEKIDALSPTKILLSGYSYVNNSSNKVINSINDVNKNDDLNINVYDGIIKCKVEDKLKKEFI